MLSQALRIRLQLDLQRGEVMADIVCAEDTPVLASYITMSKQVANAGGPKEQTFLRNSSRGGACQT